MRADGTVLGRKFIDHPSEKDRMYRTLGRIRRFQREHGSAQTQGRWAYTKRLNTEPVSYTHLDVYKRQDAMIVPTLFATNNISSYLSKSMAERLFSACS